MVPRLASPKRAARSSSTETICTIRKRPAKTVTKKRTALKNSPPRAPSTVEFAPGREVSPDIKEVSPDNERADIERDFQDAHDAIQEGISNNIHNVLENMKDLLADSGGSRPHCETLGELLDGPRCETSGELLDEPLVNSILDDLGTVDDLRVPIREPTIPIAIQEANHMLEAFESVSHESTDGVHYLEQQLSTVHLAEELIANLQHKTNEKVRTYSLLVAQAMMKSRAAWRADCPPLPWVFPFTDICSPTQAHAYAYLGEWAAA